MEWGCCCPENRWRVEVLWNRDDPPEWNWGNRSWTAEWNKKCEEKQKSKWWLKKTVNVEIFIRRRKVSDHLQRFDSVVKSTSWTLSRSSSNGEVFLVKFGDCSLVSKEDGGDCAFAKRIDWGTSILWSVPLRYSKYSRSWSSSSTRSWKYQNDQLHNEFINSNCFCEKSKDNNEYIRFHSEHFEHVFWMEVKCTLNWEFVLLNL